MQQINLAIAICGGVVIALGLMSGAIKRSVLSVPLLALGVGIATGPVGLDLLRWQEWSDPHRILKEAARLTIAISVTGIALRTPASDMRRLIRPVALLLSLGMLGMWAVSFGVVWGLLSVTPVLALLIGAILTPTDPVVASSIVTGAAAEEKLPSRLRSTLSLESGANDGLGYLIVMLPLLALTPKGADGLWWSWLIDVVIIGVIVAVAIGIAAGWLIGRALRLADAKGVVENHSFLSLSVAMSLAVLSLAKVAGSDGILAAFAAGAAFNITVNEGEDYAEENVQEAISKLFNLPIFVLFGAMLPWGGWRELGLMGGVCALALLLLRRPVTILVLGPMVGGGLVRRDVVFLGWFAPMGVAALYYALHATEQSGTDMIWHVASLVIFASILAHGITATVGMKIYTQRASHDSAPSRSQGDDPSRS